MSGSLIALVVSVALQLQMSEGLTASTGRDEVSGVEIDTRGEQQDLLEARKANAFSAEGLIRRYKDNEVSASLTFDGEPVVVSGKIASIGTELLGRPYIKLAEEPGGFSGLQCLFDGSRASRIALLRKGQSVYLSGTVQGYLLGSVILQDCEILR